MQKTENGNAFGGIFGGYECEACFFAALKGELGGEERPQCGMLFRTDGYARQGGRACCAGGFAAQTDRSYMGTDPVAQEGERGYDGRRFVWEAGGKGGSDEGGGDGGGTSEGGEGGNSSEGGSFVHYCLWRGCGHKEAGFGRIGFLPDPPYCPVRGYCAPAMDPKMELIYSHEATHSMPMTSQEVEDACYPQLPLGGLLGCRRGPTLG